MPDFRSTVIKKKGEGRKEDREKKAGEMDTK
jgi:hypothetical protein